MTMTTLVVNGATTATSTCSAKRRAAWHGHHAFTRQKAGVVGIIMIKP
jgi:hypothetical protein